MIPGARSRELARTLRQVESPHVTYIAPDGSFPIFWEEAHGCTVVDVDGNEYLDLTAAFGVMAVGHSNPRVADAVAAQARKLIHGMGDVHPSRVKVQLAQKLAERAPGDLGKTIFGTSGGDAVEAAVKTARLATGKPGVLAFAGGYHGLNLGALALTHRDDFRAPFSGQVPAFAVHAPYGQPLDDLPENVGAVLAEPVQGRAGIVVPPPGWLASLRALCDRRGALLILDEIFTGFGRTGDWFACEREGVIPDLLCVGKAMGGGLPLSACIGRPAAMDAWGESTGEALHTSTFLGHPLGCAAAIAAIAEIEEKDLTGRARAVGAHFRELLCALQRRRPEAIREVRGRGLMLGLRLADRTLALNLVTDLLRRRLIVLPAGDGDVLEFTPPLTLTEAQAEDAVERIEAALAERRA